MNKSLFKKFESVYLQFQIVLEKAKTWNLSEVQKKQLDDGLKSTAESWQKIKDKQL